MKRLHTMISAVLFCLLLPMTAGAVVSPTFNSWSSSGPFKTGQGNRVITALAVRPDGKIAYAGTGSSSVFSYAITPPAATPNAATAISTTGATLNGTVNANNADTTVSFDYGTTTAYGMNVAATPATATGMADTPISAAIADLTPGITYHYRVVAANRSGTTYGDDAAFTTVPLPPSSPAATAATSVTSTGFRANWGTVAGATGYRLDVAADSGFTSLVTGYSNKNVGNVTSSAVSGLTAGTTYYYRLRAYNTGGTSDNSNTISKLTTPATPAATAATTVTATGFTTNWVASTGATSYRLDVATNNTFTSLVTGYSNKNVGNVTSSAVSGLASGTTHYYRVRAYNASGASDNSNTISKLTIPAAPVATTATSVTKTGFTANWGTVTGATGYRLDVATNSTFTKPVTGYSNKNVGKVTSFVVSGLTAGATYYYRVRACNASGTSANSNTISKATIPAAPTATAATSVTKSDFTAKWGAVTGATSYRLDVATNSTFTKPVTGYSNKNVGKVTSFAVRGLHSGTSYYYRVRACNAGGTSANSNTIARKTALAAPAATTAASAGKTCPELILSSLADGTITNASTLNISGTVTPIGGIRGLTINSRDIAIATDGSFSHALTLIGGTSTLTTSATDSAGVTTIDTRSITLDKNAPVLTITVPADNSVTSNGVIIIKGNTDALNSVTSTVNGADKQSAQRSGETFEVTHNLVRGLNTALVTVSDLDGNRATVKRTIQYEPNAPAIAITDPAADMTTEAESLTIRGAITDAISPVTTTITVNGAATPLAIGTDGSFAHQVDLGQDKETAIVVTATDQAGNRASVQRNIVLEAVK